MPLKQQMPFATLFRWVWYIQELRSRVLLEAPDELLVHDTSNNSPTTADAAKATTANTTADAAKTPVANSAAASQSPTFSNILRHAENGLPICVLSRLTDTGWTRIASTKASPLPACGGRCS